MSPLAVAALLVAAWGILMAFSARRDIWRMLRWKKRPIRNVATLGDTDDASVEEEVIATSGPLKPQHRRQAVRDPRLLPKPPQ